MGSPVVSVVMITYGHEKYIREAIENVLNQDCDFEYELIIANDCSPDNTDVEVKKIIDSHDKSFNVRYTRHDVNLGLMPNFIWAMNQSKGKYIAICEGDDYWTDPLKLQKQVDYKSEQFKDRKIVPKEAFISKGGACYCTASAVFKKEMIDNLPAYFKNCFVGDFPLALLAISNGEIGYLDDQMAVYRIMAENSWSANMDTNLVFKENKIRNTFMTIRSFNEFTDNKYNSILKNLKSLCSYQFLYSYFAHVKSVKNRIKKYISYGSDLNIKHRSKILVKILIN